MNPYLTSEQRDALQQRILALRPGWPGYRAKHAVNEIAAMAVFLHEYELYYDLLLKDTKL